MSRHALPPEPRREASGPAAARAGAASTLFEKIWRAHVVEEHDGYALLFADRHLVCDGSFHAFDALRRRNVGVARPALTLATADHYVPTVAGRSDAAVTDPAVARVLRLFRENTAAFHVQAYGMDHAQHGIAHVVGPEVGFTLPGTTVMCGDSHTPSHGGLGALGFGIGATDVAHVLATQALWVMKPRSMRIRLDGRLAPGVFAKDLALWLLARLGPAAASGHVVEFAGEVVARLSVDQRCTLCNMSVEMGARSALVAPDSITAAFVEGRPMAPAGPHWDRALDHWRTLRTDSGAAFDVEHAFDASEVAPMVSWGTSPDQSLPIGGRLPRLEEFADVPARERALAAFAYMGLEPGAPIRGVPVDQVFIGSCTNGRLEDLRAAAAVVQAAARRVAVPATVSPGSAAVGRSARKEGLDRVFTEAGFDWREAGCSMCVGVNGDTVAAGRRCASTSNRNFPGRQGVGARTHLVSPATAAATALLGRLAEAGELR